MSDIYGAMIKDLKTLQGFDADAALKAAREAVSLEDKPPMVEITFLCKNTHASSTDPLAQRVNQAVRFTVKGKSYYLKREVWPDDIYNKALFKPSGHLDDLTTKVMWDNDEAMSLWKDLKANGFEEYSPDFP